MDQQNETPNSGVPKNFIIKCLRCKWGKLTSGTSDDLVGLHEVHIGCRTCGKWRKFKCPNCGMPSPMKRIKGNS